MKFVLLFSIKLYQKFYPKKYRGKCLFKESCSNYVYRITLNKGFFKGIQAFKERFYNCRSGYQYVDVKGEIFLLSYSHKLYKSDEINKQFKL